MSCTYVAFRWKAQMELEPGPQLGSICTKMGFFEGKRHVPTTVLAGEVGLHCSCGTRRCLLRDPSSLSWRDAKNLVKPSGEVGRIAESDGVGDLCNRAGISL